MTRILVLTPQLSGDDGVSVVSREVIAALASQRPDSVASLEVWSLHDEIAPPSIAATGVRFRAANGSRLIYASFAMRHADVNAETLVVVLHAHLLPVTLPLIRRGARVVALLLGIEAWKPMTRLQRAALRRAWRVAAISCYTIDRFRAANRSLADLPIEVCYPGRPMASSSGEPLLEKTPNVPFALIVGRMSSDERYKGHDELLETWATVTAAVPGAVLVVAGSGDDEHRLRTKAAALGLDGSVRFEGRVSDARLAMLYQQATCFVMPSRDEGFGLVFLEAMQAGTPCIAAYGAAEEIFEDGVSGLIVDPRGGGALASAVVRLLSDRALRDAMGHAARRRVMERFGTAQFAERLLNLLALADAPHRVHQGIGGQAAQPSDTGC
jgi:phosphatidyl-myo-inositol dimannoside synthase